MLISAVALLMTFWNHNNFDNFMATRLYKLYRPNIDGVEKKRSKAFKQSEFMKPRFLFNPIEYCRDQVPDCIACRCAKTCCGPNRLERGFAKARDKVAEEINIIEIIKSIRY